MNEIEIKFHHIHCVRASECSVRLFVCPWLFSFFFVIAFIHCFRCQLRLVFLVCFYVSGHVIRLYLAPINEPTLLSIFILLQIAYSTHIPLMIIVCFDKHRPSFTKPSAHHSLVHSDYLSIVTPKKCRYSVIKSAKHLICSVFVRQDVCTRRFHLHHHHHIPAEERF